MSRIHTIRGARRLVGVALGCMLLGVAGTSAAQTTGRVAGTVVDARTGAPVPDVFVHAEDSGRGAVTDGRGRFLLTDLPAGERVIVAARIGFAPARRAVLVRSGETTELDVALTAEAVALADLVVSVSREAQRRAETAASIGVVGGEALRDARPAHPSDVMRRIPGVWVSVTGGEGHMTAIRQPQTTNPVYLFLEDGVPTRSTGFFNHNALYEVNLPQADRIEVLKGPATALYGSDAIGGTINVGTRAPSPEPRLEASLEGGSHGWGRLLASGGGTWGANGVRLDLNLTRTDGWRAGTAYDRQAGTLRWDRSLGGALGLKTVATFSRIDQQTAGSSAISRQDYENNPVVNYTPISFRDVQAFRLSTELAWRSERSLLTLTPFVRTNEMEMLPNWSLTYDPAVSTSGHRSIGLLAKYRRDFERYRARLIAGVDLDLSPGDRFERAVQPTREGAIFTDYAPGEVIYDYDVTFRGASPYLQTEISPIEPLRFAAGLRYDRLGYEYDSRLDPVSSGPRRRPADTSVAYDHLSPKLGATYIVSEALSLYAAYGHGFRAPSEGQLFRQGSAANTVDLRPVKADSYEAGVRGRIGDRLDYEVGAYRMVKKDDILSYTQPDGTRETVNAGRTAHRGVELRFGAALTDAFRLDASYTIARHTYESWRPKADVDLGGNEMEQAPREVGSVRLGYEPDAFRGGKLSMEWTRIGPYWMDAENTARYDGHDLLGLRADLPVGERIALFGRVANLTDARFAEQAAYTRARGEEFAPGLPRTFTVGIAYH